MKNVVKFLKKGFLTGLLIGVSFVTKATIYYVSNSGNDSNSGLAASQAWKTLDKVNSFIFKAGDQILFERGSIFYGALIIKQSGAANNPISYSAYGTGTNPIITGFTKVTGWTNKGNNIWESTNTVSSLSQCNMVTINGENMPMGSYPKIFVPSNSTNIALNKPTKVSSFENTGYLGTNAVDGNNTTRWSSGWGDIQWLQVDLGSTQDIRQIHLVWESAYPSSFQIQVSDDETSWITIYSTTSNTGGTNYLTNLSGKGRFVRMYSTKRATEFGTSLFEFEIFNTSNPIADNVTQTSDGFYKIDSHSGNNTISSSSLSGSINWTGAEIIARISNYEFQKSLVTSQTGNTIIFNPIGSVKDGYGFFFQNDIRACTQQNDWFFNSSNKKISLYSTTEPKEVNVASIDNLIQLQADFISISNINLVGSNNNAIHAFSYNNNISIKNINASFIGICVCYTNASNFTFENNVMENINGAALDAAYGNDAIIRNNYAKNIGIHSGMRGRLTYGNYAAIGVSEYNNSIIENNTIINTGYNGINFYGQNVLVKHNFIDTYCTALDDGGGIYTYSGNGRAPMNNVIITGNIVINGVGRTPGINSNNLGAAGIYLDEESKNVIVSNNSISNTFLYGIQCNINAGNNSFIGNTVFNGSIHQFFSSYWGGEIPMNNRIANNTFVGKFESQSCLSFGFAANGSLSGENVFSSAHYLDSNIYAKPIAETYVINSNNNLRSLSEWKTISGKETHSKGSPQTISNVNDLQFEYNASQTAKTITLSQPMIDMKGNIYNGSITLEPYTSAVLMKVNGTGPSPSAETNITAFSIPGQVGSSVINSTARTIAVTMPYGTNLTSLIPSFSLSPGASAKVGSVSQVSGTTANNFTNPLVYTITAQDTKTSANWTVSVSAALNTQTNISSFSVPGQTGNAVINSTARTIAITMPSGTSLTSLVATFALSTGATAKVGSAAQTSGTTANNFTNPLVYTITAQDGKTTANWTVTVSAALNTQTNISSFSIPGQTGNAVINSTARTITINMPSGTPVTNLVATFGMSTGATAKVGAVAQTSGTSANNFTNSLVYTITAQDGKTTANWTVTVVVTPNSPPGLSLFTLPGQSGSSAINSTAHTVSINMPYGTSIINLAATFVMTNGATAKVGTINQTSGTSVNNFTSPVVYTLTSQDGKSSVNWTVTVTILPEGQRTQVINLKAGWNSISFNVIPSNTDFTAIFEPLITSGNLIKVQDEKGNFMVNTEYGWYNSLGALDSKEGYNVKVNFDAQLIVKGTPVATNTMIPLTEGFNIISYPLTKSFGTMYAVKSLIDEGSLLKVQDEAGNFVIKNGSTWFSNIDSLRPGKAYYVTVNKNTSINFSTLKSNGAIYSNQQNDGDTYFQKSFLGNPYFSMNFVFPNLSKSSLNLTTGDEIGIFDGTSCVGKFIYDGLKLVGASAGMEDTKASITGFNPGDSILFKVWKPAEQKLIDNITATFSSNSSRVFTPQGTAIVELGKNATSIDSKENLVLSVKNYPNPFIDYTLFEFKVSKSSKISLEIYDISGKKINVLTNQKFDPGDYSVKWDGTNQRGEKIPGLYMYYFNTGDNYFKSGKIVCSN